MQHGSKKPLPQRYGHHAKRKVIVLDPNNPKHAELCADLADETPCSPEDRAELLCDMGLEL